MKAHLKHHALHLAMCAPMLVIAIVLIIGGTDVAAAVLPVLGCVLMMTVMMWAMATMGGRHGGHGHRH